MDNHILNTEVGVHPTSRHMVFEKVCSPFNFKQTAPEQRGGLHMQLWSNYNPVWLVLDKEMITSSESMFCSNSPSM